MLGGVEREDGEQRRGGFSRTDHALWVRQTMSGKGPKLSAGWRRGDREGTRREFSSTNRLHEVARSVVVEGNCETVRQDGGHI